MTYRDEKGTLRDGPDSSTPGVQRLDSGFGSGHGTVNASRRLQIRPTEKERVDRYVGQIERVRKQLVRLSQSMVITLDGVTDFQEERRLQVMTNQVMRAANTLGGENG